MTLPQETIDKIKADAEKYADLFKHGAGYRETAYADGATEWVGKAQPIVKLLEKMVERFQGAAESADQDIDMKLINKCKRALAKYKEVSNG